MTRKECLDAAAGCVLRDRNNEYGGPEDSFSLISSLWSAYLGVVVDTVDVAMMMGMLKMARIRGNKGYADGFVDLAGYAACGAECATAQEEIGKTLDEHGAKIVKRIVDEQVEGLKKSLFAKAEGCEELVDPFKDAPQTKEELMQRIVESNPAIYGAHLE